MNVFLDCSFQQSKNFVRTMRVQNDQLWSFWTAILQEDVPKPLLPQDVTHPCPLLIRPKGAVGRIKSGKGIEGLFSFPPTYHHRRHLVSSGIHACHNRHGLFRVRHPARKRARPLLGANLSWRVLELLARLVQVPNLFGLGQPAQDRQSTFSVRGH